MYCFLGSVWCAGLYLRTARKLVRFYQQCAGELLGGKTDLRDNWQPILGSCYGSIRRLPSNFMISLKFTDFRTFFGDSDPKQLPSRHKKRNFSRQIVTFECFPVKSQLSQLSSKCNVARTSETQRKVEKSRNSKTNAEKTQIEKVRTRDEQQ